jgi:hypothetical protein
MRERERDNGRVKSNGRRVMKERARGSDVNACHESERSERVE